MNLQRLSVGGLILVAMTFCIGVMAQIPAWDMNKLDKAPAWSVASGIKSKYPNVKGIFFQGLPFGKLSSTRVFAWLGLPEQKGSGKCPGMVLVHGGGGTAFEDWVKLWTDRGYAAIAMDTCGCISGGTHGKRPRHKDGGPGGWGGWQTIDAPVADQWAYHAVADIILAHSLLRSLPEVDPARIGLTGISWGGYLTCLTAGTDARFKLAVPVYGCGFYNEAGSNMKKTLDKLGKNHAAKWMAMWDASNFLPRAKMPMLWVNGSNDPYFPLTSMTKSMALPTGPKNLCIKIRLVHGQTQGATQPEIFAFVDAVMKGSEPLVTVTAVGQDGNMVWAEFHGRTPVKKAELVYTCANGPINGRKWETAPAAIKDNRVTATLPAGVTAWYFNLTDSRGLLTSSIYKQLK